MSGEGVWRRRPEACLKALHRARKRFNPAQATATLDLHTAEIAWAETGRADHLTVWAVPGLLGRVLQCEHGH